MSLEHMIEKLTIKREVEIEHIHSVLKRMSNTELEYFQVYAFGYTFAPLLKHIPIKLNYSVELIYKQSTLNGLWKLIPIPRSQEFAFIINNTSYIFDIFLLLDEFLHITFLYAEASENGKIVNLLSSGCTDETKMETKLSKPFILHTFDLDSPEFESGLMEKLKISDEIPSNIKEILGF